MPLPYYIDSPGGTKSIEPFILIDDEPVPTENFHKTFVTSRRAQIPTLVLAWILSDWHIFPISDLAVGDYELNSKINRLYLKHANQNAILVAYYLAEKEVDIIDRSFVVTYIDERAKTELQIGDIILLDHDSLTEVVSQYSLEDEFFLTVMRDDEELEVKSEIVLIDDESRIGIVGFTLYDYITVPAIEILDDRKAEGPSAGFMMSLAIFDQLVDMQREDLKIAGSGTIDIEGNIGSIGGLEYKIISAAKDNMDYFFIGIDDYEQAKAFKQEHNLNINVKGFANIEEAVNYLYR